MKYTTYATTACSSVCPPGVQPFQASRPGAASEHWTGTLVLGIWFSPSPELGGMQNFKGFGSTFMVGLDCLKESLGKVIRRLAGSSTASGTCISKHEGRVPESRHLFGIWNSLWKLNIGADSWMSSPFGWVDQVGYLPGQPFLERPWGTKSDEAVDQWNRPS